MILGGILALTGTASGQELQWRPVGAARAPAIIPAQATAPAPSTALVTPAPGGAATASGPMVVEQLAPPKPIIAESNAAAPTGSGPVVSPAPANPAPMITGGPVFDGCAPPPDACAYPECCGPLWMSPGTWFGQTGPAGHRGWVRGEFLAWYGKGANAPVLLTTSATPFPFTQTANGTVVINPATVGNVGSLGDRNASVLLNGSDLNEQFMPGFRIAGGYWFDPCGVHGIDGSFFFLPGRTGSYSVDTNQIPTLYRPYFAVNAGLPETGGVPGPSREVVGVRDAGIFGRFDAEWSTQLWGADLNYRRNLFQGCTTRIDGFAGFRYLSLDERLEITETIQFTRNTSFTDAAGTVVRTVPAGLMLSILDRFTTKNDFYGGQVGVDIEVRRDRWTFGIRPSVAIGCTQQNLSVVGAYRETFNGQTTAAFPSGLYALSSNIGQRSDTAFTWVPEVGLRVGYDVTPRLRASVGYDFLYWSSVIRPGDQIDTNLDVVRIPPPGGMPVVPARPAALFETTDFWAQGVNLGIEYRW
jgi:hypothetical protein